MRFEHPAVLLGLIVLPLLWFLRPRTAGLAFPGIFELKEFKRPRAGLRDRAVRYLPWLRLLTMAALLVAVAGPQLKSTRHREVSRGVAIELVVDRSASMATEDMEYRGRQMSRIDVVKRLSRDFVAGRPNDAVGLVSFAADPITLSPLTLSHDRLLPAIDKLQLAAGWEEDGTAIGNALALAAARLHVSAPDKKVSGKLIVLITDGENNMGARTPDQAAELAKQWGVKIYAIAIRPEAVSKLQELVERSMSDWTAKTGGIARTARDSSALEAIYHEIDRLEPADLESVKWDDSGRGLLFVLLTAAALMGSELVLRETWLRKAPA